MSNDNYLIVSAIYNGALFVLARATIDDDVHQVLVALINLLRVGEVGVDLILFISQGGGHDRRTELPHDVRDDGLVGDADTDGLLLALEDARDVVVGFQNEGEGPRQVALHHLEDVVVDGLGELAQHAEVVEDKREVGLLLFDALDLADALEGARVVDAASQAVQGVGREDDGAPVSQTFQNHLDVAWVGIRRVEFEYHGLAKNFGKNSKMLPNKDEKLYFCSPSTGYFPQMFFVFMT